MRPVKRVETTFCTLLIGVVALGHAGCGDDAATPTLPAASAPAEAPADGGSIANRPSIIPGENGQPDRLMIDRFTFVPPADWTMRGVRNVEVVRIFEKGDPASPDARITIYRRQADSPDVDANAAAYAATWSGAILDDEVSLGRTEARFMSRDHPGEGLQIVDAVLCRWFHEDFIIQGEATPDEDVSAIVKDIADSWQWMGRG